MPTTTRQSARSPRPTSAAQTARRSTPLVPERNDSSGTKARRCNPNRALATGAGRGLDRVGKVGGPPARQGAAAHAELAEHHLVRPLAVPGLASLRVDQQLQLQVGGRCAAPAHPGTPPTAAGARSGACTASTTASRPTRSSASATAARSAIVGTPTKSKVVTVEGPGPPRRGRHLGTAPASPRRGQRAATPAAKQSGAAARRRPGRRSASDPGPSTAVPRRGRRRRGGRGCSRSGNASPGRRRRTSSVGCQPRRPLGRTGARVDQLHLQGRCLHGRLLLRATAVPGRGGSPGARVQGFNHDPLDSQ